MFGSRKLLPKLVVSFLALFCLPPAVSAHGLHVFAWVEDDTCHVESYFSQSKRAEHAAVDVFDMNGHRLLSGTTDEGGNFSFKIPVRADLRIVVTQGMGHKNDFVLRAEEIGALADKGVAGERAATTSAPVETEKPVASPVFRTPVLVDADVLDKMIREALDHSLEHALEEKLEPLYAKLRETGRPKGVSVRDVIAGLGYIVGIFGLVIFLTERKKRK